MSSVFTLKGLTTQLTETVSRKPPPQLASCTFILTGIIKIEAANMVQ